MRWTYPAARRAPRAARGAARQFAIAHGASAETLDAIAVCVSEAATKVVVHDYRDRSKRGLVELAAYADEDGSLWFHVRDQGHGIVPRPDSPGLGIGLPIISHMATAMAVRTPEDGGTEIVMEFEVRQAAEASPSLTLGS